MDIPDGFRLKHFITYHIIHPLNHCVASMRRPYPEFTLALLYKLSTTFDMINHEILPYKMNDYEIRGIVHDMFRSSYLSDRQQCIEIDGTISQRVSFMLG